jgi:hypothetical protein
MQSFCRETLRSSVIRVPWTYFTVFTDFTDSTESLDFNGCHKLRE